MNAGELRAAITNAINSASVRGGSKTEAVDEIMEYVSEYLKDALALDTASPPENRQET